MTYSKMLVWGEGFARDLAKYNPQQKFVATGNHIIEKITVPKVPKKSNEKIKLGFFLYNSKSLFWYLLSLKKYVFSFNFVGIFL